MLDDAVEAGQGDSVPPRFELGQELTTAEGSRVGIEDRDDMVEGAGGDVGHTVRRH